MICPGGATKYVNTGGPDGRLCPNLFNPYVPLLTTIVLILLDPDHHLTPYPMDTHKKKDPKLLKLVIYMNFQ
jgi:hypothetical protein